MTKKEEVGQILPEVVRTCDALYVTGSNLVNSQIATIVEMATKANVVTITHLDDLVAKGVLLGVCSDSYQNGRLVGEKAVRILKGAKPSSIPIESPKEQSRDDQHGDRQGGTVPDPGRIHEKGYPESALAPAAT